MSLLETLLKQGGMLIDLVCYRDVGVHEQDARENYYSMFAVISQL